EPMMEGIAAAGCGAQFRVFILSDTNIADHAADEEAQFATLTARWEGRLGVTYRRRTDNIGFKAGNVFDFCTRWGGDYEFAATPGRLAHPEPRPDRGGADAPRRLRGARAAGRRRELGGEPDHAARVHPPRPALGAGQHAVLAVPGDGRAQGREPLPDRLCDA